MKVSVNWIRQFTDVDMPVDELVKKIGAQLGAVEEVIDLGSRYQGIVISRVVSCQKHPDADKLSVCTIDDGGNTPDVKRDERGHVQVVCGAPNVREGLLVAWLPPGSTVPSTVDTDPFVLGARELRGVMSNGMLASGHELGINDDHNGIVEIDLDVQPGTDFAKAYQLDDYVIDIENKMFTHRPDCFGIVGVAREIAGITNQQFTSPEWYLNSLGRIKPAKKRLPLTITNEIPELCPRFVAIAMSDIVVKPSPLIIQTFLTRVGLKPINNVVDMTNYLMVLTGQPLHVYDYDKVKAHSADKAAIVIRKPKKGEKIALLSGKTIEPRGQAIMIATDKTLIGVGGVMGGADTEVDDKTQNIIIECANFDMYSIRRTSMEHGLFTDAVTRFNKGQSPLQNERIIEEAVAMVMSLAHGEVAGELIDETVDLHPMVPVHVRDDFINARLGFGLSAEEMAARLRNVEFDVQVNGPTLVVQPPFWRTDIEIPEDVVEEVGRLIGFDKLPVELPKRVISPAERDKLLELKSVVRDALSRVGANEVLTYSFVHGDLFKKVGQDESLAFKLSNAISPELQYYRLSLTPSLLERVHPNIKAGYDEFAIFEIGKGHNKQHLSDDEGVPSEFQLLSLVYAANDKMSKERPGAAYFYARQYLDAVARARGIELQYTSIAAVPAPPVAKPFDYMRSAMVSDAASGTFLGMIGEYTSAVRRALKLPVNSAGFEISLDELMKCPAKKPYATISKYPSIAQDITLQFKAPVSMAEISQFAHNKLSKQKFVDQVDFKFEPIDAYSKNEVHRLTLRLDIVSHERTLVAEEVNRLLDEVAAAAKIKYGAERV